MAGPVAGRRLVRGESSSTSSVLPICWASINGVWPWLLVASILAPNSSSSLALFSLPASLLRPALAMACSGVRPALSAGVGVGAFTQQQLDQFVVAEAGGTV